MSEEDRERLRIALALLSGRMNASMLSDGDWAILGFQRPYTYVEDVDDMLRSDAEKIIFTLICRALEREEAV